MGYQRNSIKIIVLMKFNKKDYNDGYAAIKNSWSNGYRRFIFDFQPAEYDTAGF